MEPDPYTTNADRLTTYLNKHTGQTWSRHSPGARLDVGPMRLVASVWDVSAFVGGVVVTLHHGQIADALPMLLDPAALRTRVREELARALAAIDTEPAS
jgi:hypothetical protein